MGMPNWFHLRSRIGKQLLAVVVDEILIPPHDSYDLDFQERIDRVYPKLVELGRQDPQAVKWAIKQDDLNFDTTAMRSKRPGPF